MTRLFLASIAIVSALAVVPYAVKAQKPTPKKGALPKSNQVYVKIILPIDPATRDKDRPVVESWIAEQLKKRGQSKFTAATAWVPLAVRGEETVVGMSREDVERLLGPGKWTPVWHGRLDDETWECPVDGRITKRADGRISVSLCGGYLVTVSLTDEPGSREIAALERSKTERGMPYVAVLIGPPPEKPAAPTDHKK
jgi:hypothetical protein